MANKMIWNEELQRMVKIGEKKDTENLKVSIPQLLFDKLEQMAKEDGFDFKGISYETEKDASGKTKHDKDGNVIFKLDKDKNKITKVIERSQGKVNSAVASYVEVAIRKLIANRPVKTA